MSALDDLLAEIRAHPRYRANVAAGTLDDEGGTAEQRYETIAALFRWLQTADGEAPAICDEATKIAGRKDMPVVERVQWLHRFMMMVLEKNPTLFADANDRQHSKGRLH
jgi:hypothetical protein